MPIDNQINYIELKSSDLELTKKFYKDCFGWRFTDYGPTYCSFSDVGIDGGFELSDTVIQNGVLLVLYHHDLEKIKSQIVANSGQITKDIFSFPGGRRFHFTDPSGNELAIWSEA